VLSIDTGQGEHAWSNAVVARLRLLSEAFANSLERRRTESRTIVGAHGGRLRAENNPDGGVTFQFTLPVENVAT